MLMYLKKLQELREIVDSCGEKNTREIIEEAVKYIKFLEKENNKLQRELNEAKVDTAYYDRRYCEMLVTIRKLKK